MPRRKQKLSVEQEAELLARYQAYSANVPKRLARDYGLHPSTVLTYVRTARRQGRLPIACRVRA